MAEDKDEPFRQAAGAGKSPAPGEGEAFAPDSPAETTPRDQDGEAPRDIVAAQDHDDASDGSAAAAPVSPPPEQPHKAKQPSRAPLLIGALILGALGGVGGVLALRSFESLDTTPTADTLAELNARAVELEKKAEASAAAVAALQGRVASAESAAGKASASADAAVSEMHKSLAASSAAPVDGGAAAPPPPAAADIAPVASRVDAVASRVSDFESKIAAVQAKLGDVEAALATPKIDARAKQDQEEAESAAKALATAHSVAVVSAALSQHVAAGVPYETDVAALSNLKVDEAKLQPLQAHAKTGVSKPGDLAAGFEALAPSLEAPEPAKAESGILERLTHDALNLVRVRRQADPSDTDVPGLVAAIESALARFDVGKAYALWSQLPPDLKAKSAKWGEAAKARLDAIAAANAIEAEAMTALGKPKS
ncbi:conserved hypothetical protein [Methylocella silvestris BL2]|uniref:Mitochondrial inner membrane protein n=1 Tax=Methylocella silvestris (strain DSM 15510 / CIP 108128 / LMG 27833 / NCIMB 13906 / BL2) TaxID=395965 RepID=B8EI27_METSB|nr:hypothetical protein [Methylocella silvestris]ACK50509.1 conserved hypothetical protein [Methylocella silvestris BL2]